MRSLRATLALHWAWFTASLCVLFAGGALLLLFVLEDVFIDQRLREVAATARPWPAGFEAFAVEAAPADLAARAVRLEPGAITEFRRADGRYVHLLRARDGARIVVYDVSDRLVVNRGLPHVLPWVAAMVALAIVIAMLMARRLVGASTARLAALVDAVAAAEDPQALRGLAGTQSIREFATLATRFADAWEARIAALRREQETLAFLAHELRTPLQSARTSLALLREGESPAAQARLTRAFDRLQRAGAAVLWLASDGDPRRERCALAPLFEELVEEFAELAASRGQSIAAQVAPRSAWAAPPALVGAVVANLLLNAIQHGGPGVVRLVADERSLQLDNPLPAVDRAGFGLGLTLVQRIAERCGWSLAHDRDGSGFRVRIEMRSEDG